MQLRANNIQVWKGGSEECIHMCIFVFTYFTFMSNLKSQSPFSGEIPENWYDISPQCHCHIKEKHVGEGLEGEKNGNNIISISLINCRFTDKC